MNLDETADESLKAHEIKLVRMALQKCKFNQKAAADLLGISRDALIRKMKKYKITINKSEGYISDNK